MNKTKVFIVDDHQIMVDGINSLLQLNSKYLVVGSTTKANEALGLIINSKADLVITDINMGEMSGIELTKNIKARNSNIKVLALSMFGDRVTINEMLEAGVDGYILKNTGIEELENALHAIENGKVFFSSDISMEMAKSIKQNGLINNNANNVHLTPRELEVIKLIADELSNFEISERLFISERTVETHRKNIFRKTDIKSVVGLIKYAIDNKII